MKSVKSCRSWSSIWTIRISSSFARPLPKCNAPIVHFIGRSSLSIVSVEDFKNLGKELRSWTRTTTTSYQFQAMFSKRTPFPVPNMDFLNGNECTSRLRKCCKKLVNPIMEDINPYLGDGTKTTITEVLGPSLGGPRSKLLNMTRLSWRTITSQQNLKEFKNTKHWVLRLNQDGAQQPLNQRPDFAQAKRECKKNARRTCEKDSTRI